MKKENRQAAQARRAAEREAAAKKAKMNGILKWVAPAVVITILVVALLLALFGKSTRNAQTAADTETPTVTAETNSNHGYDTTEGLEAKDGDLVNIDYVGYLNGEAFAGGNTNGNGADLRLGSHTYIDGFEEGIVGHKVGETFDLNLTFPENYHSADLAGKDVVFTTTLNGIYTN